MNDSQTPAAAKKERIFFRIPSKIRAKIILHGQSYAKVIIDEVSTAGLSFCTKDPKGLADLFQLTFRLPDAIRTLTVSVEIKNKTKLLGKTRIGCRFVNISDEEKRLINNYVVRLSDFSMPCIILGIASLLLSIDALWRLFAYSAILHYSRAPFLQGFSTIKLPAHYIVILSIYALVCFVALVFSDDMRKRGFILNISCLVLAFVFILIKSIMYWQINLFERHFLSINPYAWIQFALLIYTGLAIAVGVAYLRRVVTVSDALQTHSSKFLNT